MKLKQGVFAAALLLGSSGLALAQSTAPSTTTGNPQPAPTVSPSSPAARDPGVNPNATGTRDAPHSGTSANPNATSTRSGTAGLEPGANSFTEGQARSRIEDRGYKKVSKLHKDQNSIWQAEAMKDGRQVRVGVDYRGNVVEEK
jgi:periplasmic protein CpxP/Spy